MSNAKKFVLGLAIVVLIVILGFVVLYITRFRTIGTIKKLTDYNDHYDLYTMDVKYDYSLDDIINSGYQDTQGFTDAVIAESLPLLPVSIKVPSFGCSAYRTEDVAGNILMGRNYDFRLDTSCLMVRCEPKDGYRSVAFAALDNINANELETPDKKMACLTAPFVCLDGINEKGVSIATLTLSSEPTVRNTGKAKLATPLLVRLVLDKAASTDEALELIKQYDILSVNGRDYHFIINDASGNSVAVEWDCESETREPVVTPTRAITNFFVMHIDKVQPKTDNGMYGKGKERYQAILNVLDDNKEKITREVAWNAIRSAVQEPNPEDVTSNTQWSVLYDNTNCTAEIVIRRHWGDVHNFAMK